MADKADEEAAKLRWQALSQAEKDALAVESANMHLKMMLDRESRMLRHYELRGSEMPPFAIEPYPDERSRFVGSKGAGMTAAERLLRKQWIQDQVLSVNEPRYLPELNHLHRNPIGKMLAKPWNVFQRAVTPVIGPYFAHHARRYLPKLGMIVTFGLGIYYSAKYHPSSWESASSGLTVYGTKPQVLKGDPHWSGDMPNEPVLAPQDFCDRGFKNRKVLL